MNRLIYTAFVLLVFCSVGFGQNSTEKAKMLGSFAANDEDLFNEIDKVGMALETTFNAESDNVVVRVCSNYPLPIALSLSAGLPFLATARLQNFGIPKSRMFYLRQNKNCKISPNKYALTEYWFVPKDAELPEFVEARRALHLSGYEIIHAGLVATAGPFDVRSLKSEKLNPQLFLAALERVLKLLKENRSATITIGVPYYRSARTAELNKRVTFTQQFLKHRGIAGHRIYVKKIYPGYKAESFEDEPKYPDIFVVTEN